LTTFTD